MMETEHGQHVAPLDQHLRSRQNPQRGGLAIRLDEPDRPPVLGRQLDSSLYSEIAGLVPGRRRAGKVTDQANSDGMPERVAPARDASNTRLRTAASCRHQRHQHCGGKHPTPETSETPQRCSQHATSHLTPGFRSRRFQRSDRPGDPICSPPLRPLGSKIDWRLAFAGTDPAKGFEAAMRIANELEANHPDAAASVHEVVATVAPTLTAKSPRAKPITKPAPPSSGASGWAVYRHVLLDAVSIGAREEGRERPEACVTGLLPETGALATSLPDPSQL